MKFGDIFGMLKQSASEWSEDKAPTLGAALAYYTAFSIAPLLVVIIGIAGIVLGHGSAQSQVLQQAHGLLGEQGGKALDAMVQGANKPGQGMVATIIGVISLLVGASGVFGQLRTSLNAIWEVEPKPGRGVWGFVKDRILSFGMVLVLGFLLLVSLVLTAVVAGAGKWLGNIAPGMQVVGQIAELVVSFGVITLLFALMFKFLSDVEIAWGDVWLGAAITALLFTIGKFALGLYLGKTATSSTYGAAGSLLVLLLWVYYSAQILFFGAEFTQVYANRFGSKMKPAEDARPAPNSAKQSNQTPA